MAITETEYSAETETEYSAEYSAETLFGRPLVYTKALKCSENLNFNPFDLKIDMHTNGAIGRNFYY